MYQEPYMRWLLRSPWFYGFAGLMLGIVLVGAMVVVSGGGTSGPTPPSLPATTIAPVIPTTEPPWTEPPTTEPPTHTIRGTFTVQDFAAAADYLANRRGFWETDRDTLGWLHARVEAMKDLRAGKTFTCSAGLRGGYDDISAGTQVTVTDEGGTLIGTGQLTGGKLSMSGCRFTYRITTVPEARFYKIEVSHRGGLTYSFDEMTNQDWKIASTLGG
jgi:hypothetical protein